VLGGLNPGKEYIKSLLEKGKSVITANKDIIADCGQELIAIAQKNGKIRVETMEYGPLGRRNIRSSAVIKAIKLLHEELSIN
ncbi:MAG: hypothetical protein EBX03_12725, partial [Rhodobacteraceae bacterium]|nr:hypothetical protein [Paracoccaceae bacterium]